MERNNTILILGAGAALGFVIALQLTGNPLPSYWLIIGFIAILQAIGVFGPFFTQPTALSPTDAVVTIAYIDRILDTSDSIPINHVDSLTRTRRLLHKGLGAQAKEIPSR